MRKLNSCCICPDFDKFVKKNSPSIWNQLDPLVSYNTRCYLLVHQTCFSCGYTELPITDSSSSSHIDHYVKRSIDVTKTFIWDNLIVASKDDDFGAHYKDNGYKIKKTDYRLIFNPAIDHIEDYVDYATNGKMNAKKDLVSSIIDKVDKTIKVFNLNHESLKERRKAIIRIIDSYKDMPIECIRDCCKEQGFKSVIEQELSRIQSACF